MPNERARAVLDTWFGERGTPEWGHARRIWFKKNPAFDAMLAGQFAGLIDEALRGELTTWSNDGQADDSLALILLLDQFTRNSFRGTPRAFSGDTQALRIAQDMVSSRRDLTLLTPFHRAFCYMPFEHDESSASQHHAVRLFQQLADEFNDPDIESHLAYAKKHASVIAQFGRFPHRNRIVGRGSTDAERQWLAKNGGF